MGRKDIEEALQTLKNVTMELDRMAAAEGLKAIHGVGDKVDDIHDELQDFKGMIRNLGDMAIFGA